MSLSLIISIAVIIIIIIITVITDGIYFFISLKKAGNCKN